MRQLTIGMLYPETVPVQQQAVLVPVTSFTTGSLPVPPDCTTLLAPADNATGVSLTPAFLWNSVPNAAGYLFLFGETDSPDTLGITADTTVNLNVPLDPNTTYYWSAVPGNDGGAASGCPTFSFTTGDAPVPPPCTTLLEPANNATNVNDTTQFLWNQAPGATEYIVLAGLTNPPVDTLAIVTDTTLTILNPFYNTTLYWSVVPGNAGGYAEGCSVNSFTSEEAPGAPTTCSEIVSPINGATDVNAPIVTFEWTPVTDANGYLFLYGSDPASLNTFGVVADTTIALSPFELGSTFYWSIIPTNGGGNASGCPTNSFTTFTPPTPSNDNCSGAVEVTTAAPIGGTTIGATETMEAEECGIGNLGDANDDVWYKFTAISEGDATITLTPEGESFDGVMMAYGGNCGALFNIACADDGFEGDNEVMTLTDLIPGNTYYFRVYEYYPRQFVNEGSFSLTISGSALPIKLVDFKGERNGSHNTLSWTTATEQNNKGFELQRSADGKDYKTLAFINSKAQNGNSSVPVRYSEKDLKPLAATNYYRLKQIDIDGKTAYSSAITIKGIKSEKLLLSNVFPNPAKAQLKMVLSAPSNEKVILVVTDLAGRMIMQQSAQVLAGDNNLSLNVAKLPSGSYMIKVVCANGCESVVNKFVKQ